MRACMTFEENLALYLDGTLTREEQDELELHIEECQECALRLEAYRILLHETEDLSVSPPASLHARIMEAASKEKNEKPRRTVFGGMGVFTAAAAAIVLLIFSGVFGELDTFRYASSTAGTVMDAEESAAPENTMKAMGDASADEGTENGNLQSAEPDEAAETGMMMSAPDAPSEDSGAGKTSESVIEGEAEDNADGDNRSFSIAGKADPVGILPQEIPFAQHFAFVMVVSGQKIPEGTVNTKQEVTVDQTTYYIVENKSSEISGLEKSMSAQGIVFIYFYEGADYIDANSKEFLVAAMP